MYNKNMKMYNFIQLPNFVIVNGSGVTNLGQVPWAGSNSYFFIQLKFNLCKTICSSLFDLLNALFDGSYLINEINFSIYVRETSK